MPSLTLGIADPVCIKSLQRTNKRLPKAPPGWDRAKSCSVKPRASSSAMARASPKASSAVELDVGAKFNGQASFSTCADKVISASFPKEEFISKFKYVLY